MRLLVTIAHYFKQESFAKLHGSYGSGRSPFARIAALNEQIVALNKYYGSRRLSLNPDRPPPVAAGNDTLDIVVMTVRDANLLEWIGIDPATYTVAYFDGVPRMLPFEAQRIMRERAGGYDLYGYFEDDLIIDDPAFFAKSAWFAEKFGPNALLTPVRYEFAHTGTPTKVAIDHRLSSQALAPFRRMPVPTVQRGSWNGRAQLPSTGKRGSAATISIVRLTLACCAGVNASSVVRSVRASSARTAALTACSITNSTPGRCRRPPPCPGGIRSRTSAGAAPPSRG